MPGSTVEVYPPESAAGPRGVPDLLAGVPSLAGALRMRQRQSDAVGVDETTSGMAQPRGCVYVIGCH